MQLEQGLTEAWRSRSARPIWDLQGGPISIMQREIEPEIAAAIDALEPHLLPDLRIVERPADVEEALARAMHRDGKIPEWLGDWLAADAGFFARLYAEMLGTSQVRVRLESVRDNACSRFHTDNVTYRLISTYRGPGTEWLAPEAMMKHGATEVPPEAVRHLQRGWVALLRGSKADPLADTGVLHRSPPIKGTGLARLFMAIDDVS